MNTQLPQCIPATLHCTPIEPCPTINPPCHLGGGMANTYVMATNCPPATVCPQPTTLCPPHQQAQAQAQAQPAVGPTGVQHCTSSPANCGNTAWQGCPVIGPTGVQYCTAWPANCGNTAWQGCPIVGPVISPTGVPNCTSSPANCGNTAWQGCPQPIPVVTVGPDCRHGNMQADIATAATVCTQYHCGTAATVCTQHNCAQPLRPAHTSAPRCVIVTAATCPVSACC